jgi:hypothetical protein
MGIPMKDALESDVYDNHVTKYHEYDDDVEGYCGDCGEALDDSEECQPCKMQDSLDEADYNENIVDIVND